MSAGMKERWGVRALGVGSRCSGPKGCFDRGWGVIAKEEKMFVACAKRRRRFV